MRTISEWIVLLCDLKDSDVHTLMENRSPLDFLIAWSLYEVRCYSGFAQEANLVRVADRVIERHFEIGTLAKEMEHFHTRYQDKEMQRKLNNKRRKDSEAVQKFTRITRQPLEEINDKDKLFYIMYVIYRYRNNIFHGNKGVREWSKYNEEMLLCTQAMMELVLSEKRAAEK